MKKYNLSYEEEKAIAEGIEVYKKLEGFDGIYEISNIGNVKSSHRVFTTSNNRQTTKFSKILKPGLNGRYKNIVLYKKTISKTYLLHRLVAITFVENPYNKPHVNHIDGDKFNNNIYNLEWVTASENMKHAVKIGLKKSTWKGKKLPKETIDKMKASKALNKMFKYKNK